MTAAFPRLWLCADVDHPNAASLCERVGAVLERAPALVWLRSPQGFSARALLDVARALRAVAAARGAPLFVGDRVDVAVLCGADGVHLPARGLAPAAVRAWPSLRVSAAVHDAASARAAAGADALVLSPWGEVAGKGAPLGAEGFRALRALAPGRFAVALGGITTPADARAAFEAGADAVAVRRALLDAGDPAAACVALSGD